MSTNSQIAFNPQGETVVVAAAAVAPTGVQAPVYEKFNPQNAGQYRFVNAGSDTVFLGTGPTAAAAQANAVAPVETIINWLLAGFGGLIGFLLNAVWQAVKDLQSSDKSLAEKVNSIEVLVAGNYVKRDSFDDALNRIFQKLDHIEEKIDRKADK